MARQPLEYEWARNYAYYIGFQNLRYNSQSRILLQEYEENDFVINRISGYVDARVSMLTRHRPSLYVAPEKMERRFVKAAELSTSLLNHLSRVGDSEAKNHTHALLLVLTGSAFKKILWNPRIGESISEIKQMPDESINLDDRTGDFESDEIFFGDIESHVRTPFSIMASPGARDIGDINCEWVLDRTHIPIAEVRREFPEIKVRDMKKGSEFTSFESFVERLGSPTFGPFMASTGIASELNEHQFMLKKEFWMRPSVFYPRGVLATIIGDELVQFEEWPYEWAIKNKMFPFIKTDEKEDPFGFYGRSTVSRLIPIQRNYNSIRAQVAKNATLMCNVKWMVARGSGLPEDALTDSEGEIVEYNPNVSRPEQSPIAPLPNYIHSVINQDITDFEAVSGQKNPENLPYQGITAGIALETASQIAEQSVIPVIRKVERAMIKEGQINLFMANEFYVDLRKIKILGQGEAVNVMQINNDDLLSQTDVRIQIESALGHTKATQQQKLMDFWDRRIITDPSVFLQAYMTGDLNVVLKANNAVENKIIEDIEAVKNGAMPPISPFDNHVEAIRLFSQWIQSPEFRRMPEDRQQIALQVMQMHIGFLQPQLEQAEGQNPAAVGTPFGSQVTEGA